MNKHRVFKVVHLHGNGGKQLILVRFQRVKSNISRIPKLLGNKIECIIELMDPNWVKTQYFS